MSPFWGSLSSTLSQWRQKISPYHYEQLKCEDEPCWQIRLFRVSPGKKGSEIQGSLSQFSLDHAPPYEALSYVWGNPILEDDDIPFEKEPERSRAIRLDGHHFIVGRNLHSALQHLRHEDKPRILWIDAVCIDQDNMYELGQRVRIMDKIYASARLVLVWLGEANEDSHLAMDAIEDLCLLVKAQLLERCAMHFGLLLADIKAENILHFANPDFNDDRLSMSGTFAGLTEEEVIKLVASLDKVSLDVPPDAQTVQDLLVNNASSLHALGKELISNELIDTNSPSMRVVLQAFRNFFWLRSWWTRLWIMQETYFATEIQLVCGSRHIDFAALWIIQIILASWDRRAENQRPTAILHYAGPVFQRALSDAFTRCRITMNMAYEALQPLKGRLSSNLVYCTQCRCTRPVDRILALLNVSSAINLSIDYEQPTRDIFMDATKAIIEQDQSLNIICCSVNEKFSRLFNRLSYVQLPSFVPHFEAIFDTEGPVNIHTEFDSDMQYYACGGDFSSMYSRFPIDLEGKQRLLISGCSWATVVEQTPQSEHFDNTDAIRASWQDLRNWCCEPLQRWREMSTNHHNSMTDGWRALFEDRYPLIGSRRISKHQQTKDLFIAELNQALEHDDPSDTFLETLVMNMFEKSVFFTDKGEFVKAPKTAPKTVKLGNMVFVARGCSCAMILRPASPENAHGVLSEGLDGGIVPQVCEFISGAYVHGIMDGEVREMMDKGIIEEEKVWLV